MAGKKKNMKNNKRKKQRDPKPVRRNLNDTDEIKPEETDQHHLPVAEPPPHFERLTDLPLELRLLVYEFTLTGAELASPFR